LGTSISFVSRNPHRFKLDRHRVRSDRLIRSVEPIAFHGWTALFLATTILTSVTGFPIPPFGFDPPRAVGTLSLILLAIAVCAFYAFHHAGTWRWVYVVTATAALYLNCFVAIV
jgi:hypothetical protein